VRHLSGVGPSDTTDHDGSTDDDHDGGTDHDHDGGDVAGPHDNRAGGAAGTATECGDRRQRPRGLLGHGEQGHRVARGDT
jgi:hypothetical protein